MSTLVIGYGNQLRGDDGVGAQIAEIVESWQFPDVTAIAMHQLTPELAESLSSADVALFIDASWAVAPGQVSIGSIAPFTDTALGGHFATPASLLALSQWLYGASPEAWWIQIGIENTNLGTVFSEAVERAIPVALQDVRSRLERISQSISCATETAQPVW